MTTAVIVYAALFVGTLFGLLLGGLLSAAKGN